MHPSDLSCLATFDSVQVEAERRLTFFCLLNWSVASLDVETNEEDTVDSDLE